MLYKKNTAKTLSKELFQNPTSEYRATPFWAWNCKLEEKELKRQIDVMKQMGFGGFHMHVRTGMATDYLSEEYMQLIKACVQKAKDEKMLAWLYDEDRWPSGAAGGKVTKDECFRARHLLFLPAPYTPDPENADIEGRATLLACYDIVLDNDGALASYRRIAEDEAAAGNKWYAYLKISDKSPWYNNLTYVNTLDKKAIRRFLQVTHEVYKANVSEEFGQTIPAIFTDEPQFTRKQAMKMAEGHDPANLPWSDDVPETFFAAYGEDLMEKLPELFWELPDGKISTVRYHFHDHIAQRFTEAFADTCGDWCRENGIVLTGHMMEEPTLKSQTNALGEAMRSYRSFQLPGIDMLCNSYEFTTAKQTQSAVHQYGREGMLSELYGVTGWDFDLRGHKMQGDWQAALGVTVRVPHLAWLSMGGEAKRDYPASINYQSPWYTEYAYIENHFARLNTALTRGKPVVKIGVIHPVESYWLHFGPENKTGDLRRQLDENFQNVTKWLLFNHLDFDFISESLLPAQCEQGSAPLTVGCMQYDVIVVPGCETLRETTLTRLADFQKAGGKLVFMGPAPTLVDAKPDARPAELYAQATAIPYTEMDLVHALKEDRVLDIFDCDTGKRCRHFVHQLRQDGDLCWLFLAQNAPVHSPDVSPVFHAEMTLRGEWQPTLCNTLTGEEEAVEYVSQNGKTVVRFSFCEEDSFLFRLTPGTGENTLPAENLTGKAIATPEEVVYTLDEPNVLLLDRAAFKLDDEDFRPQEEILRADDALRKQLGWPRRMNHVAQPYVVSAEKPVHTATLRFTVNSEVEREAVHLALEEAADATILWNGKPVEKNIDGWYTDKCLSTVPLCGVQKGQNILEITWPFGRRTNLEWCYLLGDFGVRVAGTKKVLTDLPATLGFDSITTQGLPFYGGNVTYRWTMQTNGGDILFCVPHYTGAILQLFIDGEKKGYICTKPNQLTVTGLAAGAHTVELKLYGNRQNGFGHVHSADRTLWWIGPDAWRTTGDGWTYEYRLRTVGVTSTPGVTELVKK